MRDLENFADYLHDRDDDMCRHFYTADKSPLEQKISALQEKRTEIGSNEDGCVSGIDDMRHQTTPSRHQ